MSASRSPRLRAVRDADPAPPPTPDELLLATARGDREAFAALYDELSPLAHGVIRRVLRDPAQSEEVTQEVFVDVWRTAARYEIDRGSARSWVVTMAHRRAVDRVRSEQAARERAERHGRPDRDPGHDEVAEAVALRVEHAQVRSAMSVLTDLQREAVELAYFRGYTYREVAELLDTPLGTIKTRMRDGLIRLRDAMGVTP